MWITFSDVFGKEVGDAVGCELRHVDDQVVVTCVVARHSCEGFGVVFAGFVDHFDAFACGIFIEGELVHDVAHACVDVGDEEDLQC